MDYKKILNIENLNVSFYTHNGEVQAVRGIDLSVSKGEVLCIVGESGSGKSVTAHTIMQLIPTPPGKVKEGRINYLGEDLLKYNDREMQKIRGSEISMIFQDPMTAINPTSRIGKQIMEGLIKHQSLSKDAAKLKAIGMLKLVGMPDPESRMEQYPHEFSGGMRQRVMIAIALACNPNLLIADEPTTALDVTIQAQILDLLEELKNSLGMAIILITHDLGVVARIADRVAVMYGGKIVETGSVDEIFSEPRHPYTWGLMGSIPSETCKSKEALNPILGHPPDLLNPPVGCPFAPRCNYAMQICLEHYPESTKKSKTHKLNCWQEHYLAPILDRKSILEDILINSDDVVMNIEKGEIL